MFCCPTFQSTYRFILSFHFLELSIIGRKESNRNNKGVVDGNFKLKIGKSVLPETLGIMKLYWIFSFLEWNVFGAVSNNEYSTYIYFFAYIVCSELNTKL